MLTSGSSVLVTGCAGFIGSHLCERLLAEGYSVTGVDALTDSYDCQRKLRNMERARASARFRFLHGDILDLDPALVREAEVVFHLAARPGVRTSWGREFEEYVRSNIVGTHRLIENARRIVFASSSSIYGNTVDVRVAEDHRKNPISPYGVSKLAAEHLCTVYSRQGLNEAVSLRLFTVYGPRQRPDMAFERLIQAAVTKRKFVLYGTGEQERDFTFVGDVVNAFLMAARSSLKSDSLNIAGGAIVTMNQVIATVEELTGSPIRVERIASQSGDVWHTGADLTRSRERLGYAPHTSLREGLRAQIEEVREHLAEAVPARMASSG